MAAIGGARDLALDAIAFIETARARQEGKRE